MSVSEDYKTALWLHSDGTIQGTQLLTKNKIVVQGVKSVELEKLNAINSGEVTALIRVVVKLGTP